METSIGRQTVEKSLQGKALQEEALQRGHRVWITEDAAQEKGNALQYS